MPLGDLINKARLGKQLSLRGLARQVGIVPSYLADIENDRRTPSESVLFRISAILGLDFDAVMQQAGRLGRRLSSTSARTSSQVNSFAE